MNRSTLVHLAIGSLLAMAVACKRNDVSAGSLAGGREGGSRNSDALTTSVVRAADRATSRLELRVPKASLEALADTKYHAQRQAMVRTQLGGDGVYDGRTKVRDARVLEAMRLVPRHEFVPRGNRPYAYYDSPLPIGYEQTISQPYIVALMTELLKPKPEHRVLEIGTGSGYQAAVLALLVKEVYTIEIVDPLAKRAAADLKRLGYANVFTRSGDGYRGWPEKAPFDGVIVTAAPEKIPEPLMEQLKEGGRLVIPVGPRYSQELVVIHKTKRGAFREAVIPVRFVPMTGEIQKQRKP